MVLVSRRLIFVFFAAAVLLLLACGILGYRGFYPGGTGAVEDPAAAAGAAAAGAAAAQAEAAEAAKLAAERILYISIAGSVLLTALFVHIYFHRIRLERKIRRLATLGGTASPLYQLRSGKFGSFGSTLEVLYRRVMEVNEQQSVKLSAQSDLISLLLADSDAPIAVTDITGKILYASGKYEKRTEEVRSKLIGSSIESYEDEIVVPMIMQELETRRTYRSEEEQNGRKKRPFTVMPILDKRGAVGYLLFDFRAASPLRSLKQGRTPYAGVPSGSGALGPAGADPAGDRPEDRQGESAGKRPGKRPGKSPGRRFSGNPFAWIADKVGKGGNAGE